jgi:hypothetical protein
MSEELRKIVLTNAYWRAAGRAKMLKGTARGLYRQAGIASMLGLLSGLSILALNAEFYRLMGAYLAAKKERDCLGEEVFGPDYDYED